MDKEDSSVVRFCLILVGIFLIFALTLFLFV